ncbi:hypothetical protein BRC19_03135 [Candidatus Saccharibacteria bacterium QS_5_54_17]|nr:MAG: hypothetical protein BRC19_03135 [Candidatus Saccharibacteria bacterium QS_5_54_17]
MLRLTLWQFTAHADQSHQSGTKTWQHFLETDPWLAVPLSLALIIALPLMIYRFSHSSGAAILAALPELFLVGVLAYAVMPVLAIICISLGFMLALTLVLGSLIG